MCISGADSSTISQGAVYSAAPALSHPPVLTAQPVLSAPPTLSAAPLLNVPPTLSAPPLPPPSLLNDPVSSSTVMAAPVHNIPYVRLFLALI